MKTWFTVGMLCIMHTTFAQNLVGNVEHKADSTIEQNTLVQEVDSLQQDGKKVIEKVSSTIDSINYHTDVESRVEEKVENLEQQTKAKLKDNKAVEKVEGMDQVIDDQLDVSEKLNIEGNDPLALPESNVGDPLTTPKEQLSKVTSAPQNAINEVKNIDEVQSATDQLNQAKGVQQQVSGYTQDAKALSEGKLDDVKQVPSAIEQKAQGLEEIQELQKQAGQAEQIKQMPEQYKKQIEQYQDKEYLKQQAKAKLMEKSVDYFAEQGEALKAAQQQMQRYKRKYSSFQTEKGEFKKINSMKGKPLKERVIFGSTLQIHQGPPTAFDVGLTLAYRVTGRWSVGSGGSYRFIFKKGGAVDWQRSIYGGRVFSDYRAIKSLFLHGEFETLSTIVPVYSAADDATREWVNGAMAGIGKTYKVRKGIKGNVIFMYNFLHGENSPYEKPWVIRFGFTLE